MLQRPDACRGCPLDENPRTQGFVPPSGPTSAPILFMGEAAGEEEARTGIPFAGAAGGMLNRLLTRSHWDRRDYRVANVIACRPSNNWFDERAPWYWGARQHCAVHRDPVLREGHKVIVALGGTALKTLLGIDKGIRLEDWHGTVTPTPHGLLVPTFHPSHLQRGAHNLFGCVSFDLQQAHRVAREGFVQETPDILVDPPLEWFAWWVGQVEAACAQDPEAVWLAVDIETPDKSDGQDEGELSSDDRSYTILRVNFSVHPDEGVTVPYAGPYVALIDRLLRLKCAKLLWNAEYDRPRLEAAKHPVVGPWLDWMWLWHYLQSDLPRGLGFAAPFYSRFGAWKHLAKGDPGRYAAIDGFQTYRIATGVARDLQASGQWDTALRHVHRLHEVALRPAQQVGLLISRERLDVFIEDLTVKQRRILHHMQGMVPDEVRPLTPKGGYKREPEEGRVHSKGTELKRDGTAKKEAPDSIKQELYAQTAVLVEREVDATGYCCTLCGARDLTRTHRCREGDRALVLESYRATRWFWQEPFNPDSPPQILAYMKHRGHKPGRGKKSGADSTDRDTLQRLAKETKDPLYQTILDARSVGKVRGTYGVGTRKLMDAEDRVHPVPTFRPSTMRLSYHSPNVTNCVRVGTPIEVLRDVAAFPKGISIERVQVGDWAYTYVSPGVLGLRQVVWAGQTGEQPVVRVYWRGSRRRKLVGHVDLTADHLVWLTSGEWKAAGLLEYGDRVLSLARFDAGGYEEIVWTGQRNGREEHRWVYLTLHPDEPPPGHVHHVNENKRDNRPLNLEGKTVGDHFRHHNTGSGNPKWREDWPADPHQRRLLAKREYLDRKRAADPEGFLRWQRETRLAARHAQQARMANNHEVLEVRRLPKVVPVYDLQIAETHNFIAGELCVHNCVADKGDKPGEVSLASGFRKCVVSGETLPKWVTPEGLKAWEAKWVS